MNLSKLKRRAKEYVELEAHCNVRDIKFEQRFVLLGRDDVVLSVVTDDPKIPEWWVGGGGSPMNLYDKTKFANPDEVFSFHVGLILRVTARGFEQSTEAPEDIGYDAFICHASEDKDRFVRPLAQALTSMGYRIWYDEFELRVGDSLRQSIDRGLASSEYAIVVLSRAFFRKNWPQYELNGLTAREIEGRKVILPVWYGIEKAEILGFSPALADKVAVETKGRRVRQVAELLAEALDE